MSKEISVEKLRAGDVPYLRRDYLELIEKDFARVPGIGEKQAFRMTWDNERNSRLNMAETIKNPERADFWLAWEEDTPLAAAKIGAEHYGDRPDLSPAGYEMARLLHKSGIVRPSNAQIFALGLEPSLPDDRQQEIFNAVAGTAVGTLGPHIRKLAAFVDTQDQRLSDRMEGYRKQVGGSLKIGRKVVEISQGGVVRDYRRFSVNLR